LICCCCLSAEQEEKKENQLRIILQLADNHHISNLTYKGKTIATTITATIIVLGFKIIWLDNDVVVVVAVHICCMLFMKECYYVKYVNLYHHDHQIDCWFHRMWVLMLIVSLVTIHNSSIVSPFYLYLHLIQVNLETIISFAIAIDMTVIVIHADIN